MLTDFMSLDTAKTFVGLVTALTVIVQFTKSIVKRKFGDSAVRIYAFFVALILIWVFTKGSVGLERIVLAVINAIMVTVASMGGYEILSDPMAQKR